MLPRNTETLLVKINKYRQIYSISIRVDDVYVVGKLCCILCKILVSDSLLRKGFRPNTVLLVNF